MELIPVFQKHYGAGYQEAVKLSEMANARYTITILVSDFEGASIRSSDVSWSNLKLVQMTKYAWYFRHRAALLQLANPRKHVSFSITKTHTKSDQRASLVRTITNKITNAKGKLTKATLKLNAIQESWTELFPIESHPKFVEIQQELSNRRTRLAELEQELCAAKQDDDIFSLLEKHHI